MSRLAKQWTRQAHPRIQHSHFTSDRGTCQIERATFPYPDPANYQRDGPDTLAR